MTAKCLRCGAGNEWIAGRAAEDIDAEDRAETVINDLKSKLSSALDRLEDALGVLRMVQTEQESEGWFTLGFYLRDRIQAILVERPK